MIEETYAVCDPVELVRDLADKIGIHQLYAIACDIRGECDKPMEENSKLKMELENMRDHIEYLEREKERLSGEISGLKYAIRCNGVSGGDVG